MAKRIAVMVAGAGVVAAVAVGGLLAFRGGDSGPAVIVVAPGGATGAAATEDARTSMLAPVQEFVVAGELPALDGPARAWRFAGSSGVTAEQVSQLAAVFGVEGTVTQVPAEEGGGWRVGPADGSALTVSGSAMGDWWFSPSPAVGVARCAVVEPADADGTASSGDEVVCEEPAPPEGVPDEATALAEGQRLLAAAGVDLAAAEVTVTGDEWGRTVVAQERLGGTLTSLQHAVSFGGADAVQWANGLLARPVEADEYPRIGTAAALERLREGRTWWGGPAVLATESAIAAGGGAEGEPGAASDTGAPAETDTGAPAETGAAPPVTATAVTPPDEPLDAPLDPIEPVVVTIVGVEPSLSTVWDAQGTVWLLPSYTFLSDDGGRWEVPAVPDEYIESAPEPLPEPAPAPEPAPEPRPEPAPDEPPAAPEPAEPEAVEQYVGLTEDAALALAAEEGRPVRVVERDGESLAVTDDYSPDRVNLIVAGGVVIAARPG